MMRNRISMTELSYPPTGVDKSAPDDIRLPPYSTLECYRILTLRRVSCGNRLSGLRLLGRKNRATGVLLQLIPYKCATVWSFELQRFGTIDLATTASVGSHIDFEFIGFENRFGFSFKVKRILKTFTYKPPGILAATLKRYEILIETELRMSPLEKFLRLGYTIIQHDDLGPIFAENSIRLEQDQNSGKMELFSYLHKKILVRLGVRVKTVPKAVIDSNASITEIDDCCVFVILKILATVETRQEDQLQDNTSPKSSADQGTPSHIGENVGAQSTGIFDSRMLPNSVPQEDQLRESTFGSPAARAENRATGVIIGFRDCAIIWSFEIQRFGERILKTKQMAGDYIEFEYEKVDSNFGSFFRIERILKTLEYKPPGILASKSNETYGLLIETELIMSPLEDFSQLGISQFGSLAGSKLWKKMELFSYLHKKMAVRVGVQVRTLPKTVIDSNAPIAEIDDCYVFATVEILGTVETRQEDQLQDNTSPKSTADQGTPSHIGENVGAQTTEIIRPLAVYGVPGGWFPGREAHERHGHSSHRKDEVAPSKEYSPLDEFMKTMNDSLFREMFAYVYPELYPQLGEIDRKVEPNDKKERDHRASYEWAEDRGSSTFGAGPDRSRSGYAPRETLNHHVAHGAVSHQQNYLDCPERSRSGYAPRVDERGFGPDPCKPPMTERTGFYMDTSNRHEAHGAVAHQQNYLDGPDRSRYGYAPRDDERGFGSDPYVEMKMERPGFYKETSNRYVAHGAVAHQQNYLDRPERSRSGYAPRVDERDFASDPCKPSNRMEGAGFYKDTSSYHVPHGADVRQQNYLDGPDRSRYGYAPRDDERGFGPDPCKPPIRMEGAGFYKDTSYHHMAHGAALHQQIRSEDVKKNYLDRPERSRYEYAPRVDERGFGSDPYKEMKIERPGFYKDTLNHHDDHGAVDLQEADNGDYQENEAADEKKNRGNTANADNIEYDASGDFADFETLNDCDSRAKEENSKNEASEDLTKIGSLNLDDKKSSAESSLEPEKLETKTKETQLKDAPISRSSSESSYFSSSRGNEDFAISSESE
ncbi:unnamed protein product [Caenorhabditis auriculariae]|uniref:Uncharacterized protein n=1 Tax=Caenorhabditis auriculariae TaxID=2777116 RepID=A0A8S1H2R0_9PELO|nr:unnamed protein product [Caenorhabditis auriculariae]